MRPIALTLLPHCSSRHAAAPPQHRADADCVAIANAGPDDRREAHDRREAWKDLVDSASGKTLYTWAKDNDENSQCYDQCANFWPPLLTTAKTVAADGVTAGNSVRARAKMERCRSRSTDTRCTSTERQGSGETNGQGSTGFGAVWVVGSRRRSQARRAQAVIAKEAAVPRPRQQ